MDRAAGDGVGASAPYLDTLRGDRIRELVDTMATARWRLIRMSGLETALLDHEYEAEADSSQLPAPARTSLAYRRATDSGRSVELMNRAESRLQFQFNSAFDRLQRLRHSNPIFRPSDRAPDD